MCSSHDRVSNKVYECVFVTAVIIKNWVLNVGRLDGLHGMFNVRTCIVSSTNQCSQKVQKIQIVKYSSRQASNSYTFRNRRSILRGDILRKKKIRTHNSAGLVLSTSKQVVLLPSRVDLRKCWETFLIAAVSLGLLFS